MNVTLPTLMADIGEALSRSGGPIDVKRFLARYFPHDVEAGRLLARAFHAKLLRGRLVDRMVKFEGHISAIADHTRPVWH